MEILDNLKAAFTRENPADVLADALRTAEPPAAKAVQFSQQTWGQSVWLWAGGNHPNSNLDFGSLAGDFTQSSLVMAAVNWVGRALPEAKPRVVEEGKDGKESPIADHSILPLLRRPNPYYSGSTLAKAIALSWVLSGNVYLAKRRNPFGQVVELYWLPHWLVRPVRTSKDTYLSYYEINVDGRWIPTRLEDLIHLRDGIDPKDELRGLSPLGSLLREIFTDNGAAQYAAVVMQNMGIIPYVVSPTEDVEVDVVKIKAELIRQTRGDEAGKPVVMSGPVRLEKVGITPAEMALDALRNVPEERLAGVIGIPGMVLGFGAAWARSTFSNYAQAVESAYEGYMVPLWRYLDEEYTHQLLLRDFEDEDSPRRIEHDLSKVRALQDDEDALHRRLGMDWTNGVATRGEVRGKLGYTVDEQRDNVFISRAGTTFIPGDDPQAQFPQPDPQPPTLDRLLPAGQPRQLLNGKDQQERVN